MLGRHIGNLGMNYSYVAFWAVVCAGVVGTLITVSVAQTPPAATQPEEASTEDVFDRLLTPDRRPTERPLAPNPDVATFDRTSGEAAVAPAAPRVRLIREGSYLVDRVGRLRQTAEASGWELIFDADARAMQDPPMLVIPNLKLMLMEDQLKAASRDVRFRVTGMVTEYRGRNHILLEKVVVLPE
ncbi:MAG: hypothetical protein ACFCVE_10635 [Phycisphaerae bacterium]